MTVAWASCRPKPGEQDLGVAVGPVVAVPVGIEEQVRGLADEDAAVADRQRRGQVQPVDEDRRLVGPAVAVGVLEDLDPVGPARPARRRLGDAVVLGPEVLVDRHRLEPGRVGILQVLEDPEPPALVEAGRDRLADHRLGGEDLDVEPLGHDHPPGGLVRRESARRLGEDREPQRSPGTRAFVSHSSDRDGRSQVGRSSPATRGASPEQPRRCDRAGRTRSRVVRQSTPFRKGG